MVLAFNATYNKDNNIQEDMLLIERDGKYLLQYRTNLLLHTEQEFSKEDEAYQAFESLVQEEEYNE